MRSDMGRVVIERPRTGSSSRSLKVKRVGRIYQDEDGYEYDGPVRVPSSGQGMKRIHGKLDEKSFTDLLGPIHGYLLNSVGRKWDDVYSEIARNLGAFSWPLQHIMQQHIDVETKTHIDPDGRIYAQNKRGVTEVGVTSYLFGHRSEFYVHPVTRTLCVPELVKDTKPRVILSKVKIDDTRWFVFIRGNWYIGTYRKSEFLGVVKDSGWGADGRRYQNKEYGGVDWPNYQVNYGDGTGTYLFSVIKQANKKEIRKLRELQK